MKICLVTSRVPPTRDGVGDYTYHLGRELARRGPVTIVTTVGQRAVDGRDGLTVLPIVPRWDAAGVRTLVDLARETRPSLLDLQWVPFLWGRGGINPWIPRAVLALRRAGIRVVTTVHEPYVPFTYWKWWAAGPIQRLQLWTIVAASHRTAVTIPAWVDMLRRRVPWRRRDIFWLPAGSNVPRAVTSDDARRRQRAEWGLGDDGVVLTLFSPMGSGKLLDWVAQAWRALRHDARLRLLVIGPDRPDVRARLADAADPRVIDTGYVATDAVSRLLACSDVLLAPFVDGMSSRRTSVISALEHALPVVTTSGRLSDPMFADSPLVRVPVTSADAFTVEVRRLVADAAERRRLGAAAREFWAAHFAWPVIADRLLHHADVA